MLKLGAMFVALATFSTAWATPLPPSLRSAGVTQAEYDALQLEVTRAARARNVSERALRAVADRLGVRLAAGGRLDVEQLLTQIDARAADLAELQSRIIVLESANNTAISAILGDVRTAIEAGDLELAQTLLTTARQAARQASSRALIQETEVIGVEAELLALRGDFRAAADLYAQAAETAPAAETELRWRYRLGQAEALAAHGRAFFDAEAQEEALRVYQTMVLPLAPRGVRPLDWAATSRAIGRLYVEIRARTDSLDALEGYVTNLSGAAEVYEQQGETAELARTLRDMAASVLAEQEVVAGFARNALSHLVQLRDIYAELSLRRDWIEVQNLICRGERMLGVQASGVAEARAMFNRAEIACRAALADLSQTADPLLWGEVQHNLGAVMVARASAGEANAWRQAVTILTEGANVITRERYPARWAIFQAELGAAYRAAGSAHYAQAIAAFEAAIAQTSRERSPSQWLSYRTNLARTFIARGAPGDFARADPILEDVLTQATSTQFDATWEIATVAAVELELARARAGDRSRIEIGIARADAAIQAFNRTLMGAPRAVAAAQALREQLAALR